MRVESLDDLREFHKRVVADGFPLERVVNHGSAIGCYFRDPEGNTTEVFWRSPRDCWVPTGDRSTCRSRTTSSWRRSTRRLAGARTCWSAGSSAQVAAPSGSEGGERAVRADPDQPAPARTSQAEKFKDTIEQVRLA